jgi:hypothetical protein
MLRKVAQQVAAPSDTDGQMAETGTSNATVPLAAAAGALAVLGNRHATRLARFPTA